MEYNHPNTLSENSGSIRTLSVRIPQPATRQTMTNAVARMRLNEKDRLGRSHADFIFVPVLKFSPHRAQRTAPGLCGAPQDGHSGSAGFSGRFSDNFLRFAELFIVPPS